MSHESLAILWYALISLLFFIFCGMDGFDIGVGIHQLFCKKVDTKERMVSTILPFWDPNSLWIVLAIGSLLTCFPGSFGAFLSSNYLAFSFLVFSFLIRTATLETQRHVTHKALHKTLNYFFGVSSVLMATTGAILAVDFLSIENASTLIYLAACSLALSRFSNHGLAFLLFDDIATLFHPMNRLKFSVLISLVSAIYFFPMIGLKTNFALSLLFGALFCISEFLLLRSACKKRYKAAFFFSCLSFAFLILGIVTLTFSNIGHFQNGASAPLFVTKAPVITLQWMTSIAAIGLPLFILYNALAYRALLKKRKKS